MGNGIWELNDKVRGLGNVARGVGDFGGNIKYGTVQASEAVGTIFNAGSIVRRTGNIIRGDENNSKSYENDSERRTLGTFPPLVQAREQTAPYVREYNQGTRYTDFNEQTGLTTSGATPSFVPAGYSAAAPQPFVGAPAPQQVPVGPVAQQQPQQPPQAAPVGQPVQAAAARPAPTIVIQSLNQATDVFHRITYAVAHVMEAPPNSDAQRQALQGLRTVLNTPPFQGEDTQLVVHPRVPGQITRGELSYDFTKQGAGHYRPPVGLTITAEQVIHGILDGNPGRYGALKQTISGYLDDPSKPLVQSGPPAPAAAAPVAANTPPAAAPAAPAVAPPPAPAPAAAAPAAPVAPPVVTPVVSRTSDTVNLAKELPPVSGQNARNYSTSKIPPIDASQVKALQGMLAEANPELAKMLRVDAKDDGIDGKFGDRTLKAVKSFAESKGIAVEKLDFKNPNDPETKEFMKKLQDDLVAKRRGQAAGGPQTAQAPAAPAAAPAAATPPAAAPVDAAPEAPAPAPVVTDSGVQVAGNGLRVAGMHPVSVKLGANNPDMQAALAQAFDSISLSVLKKTPPAGAASPADAVVPDTGGAKPPEPDTGVKI